MTAAPAGQPVDWAAVRLPGVDEATVAVVLGAAGAIGRRTCAAFAAAGATVVPVTRLAEQGAQLAQELVDQGRPARVVPATADLADSASLVQLVDDLAARGLTPTALVNSAAIGAPRTDLTQVTREQVTRMFDVNVVGAFEAVKAVAGPMRQAGHGRVVNVASIAAQRVLPGASAYGASKAALISLTQHLAVDLGPDGITVNSVSPGQTPTRLRAWDEPAGQPAEEVGGGSGDEPGVPLRRRGRLDDYVGAVLFLCSSLASYVTGVDVPVEGGARLVRARSY